MIEPSEVEELRPPLKTMSLVNLGIVRGSPLGGLGVFSGLTYERSDIVEVAPLILISPEDRPAVDNSVLYHHMLWDVPEPGWAVIMGGFGSFYNHADDPNCVYVPQPGTRFLPFVARRLIVPGEELTISYGSNIWFDKK